MKPTKTLQNMQPSYIREILKAANSKDVISFAGGLPSADSFPLSLMKDSLNKMPANAQLFQYASTEGHPPLLEHCQAHYQLTPEHQSLICNGSQQALDLIARAFINPGDKILVEAPSYLGALQVFSLAQAEIVSIAALTDGENISELARLLSENDIKIFYAVPDFHNPTGACWPLDTRRQVAQLCRDNNVTFIEDAPYRPLRFSGKQLPLVASFCPEQALVLRSFSKIIAPGMRIGLVSAKSAWIQALIKVKQAADLHTNTPMQALLLDILQHPDFASHTTELIQRYRERYQYMAKLINRELSNYAHFDQVEGGMFIWLKLENCDVLKLAEHALCQGVAVVPSSVFYNQATSQPSALRLNFSHSPKDKIALGVERLALSLKRFC